MADVEVTCDKCGETLVVSEFIDRDRCFCRNCGSKIAPRQTTEQVGQKLHLKRNESPPALTATDIAGPTESANNKAWLPSNDMHASKAHSQKAASFHNVTSWIIFILLGGVMGVLRYTNWITIDFDYQAILMTYGPFVVLAFHILILLKAFKDSIFQGILCLLVPCYSLYYMFLISDDFYLRAVFGGLLVGIGQYSADFYQTKAMEITDSVTAWIASGG